MDIFVRLLRGDAHHDGPEAALAAIESAAREARHDAGAARGALRRVGRRHHALVGIGQPLHDVYRAAFEALEAPVSVAPDQVRVVHVVDPSIGSSVRAVQRAVRRARESVVLVRCEQRSGAACAGSELEALALLGGDERTGLVVVGTRDVLVRRVPLVDAFLPGHAVAPREVANVLGAAVRAAGWVTRSVGS